MPEWKKTLDDKEIASGKDHLALAVFRCFSCSRTSQDILGCLGMSQDALGQLKNLKTARARWPFPDVWNYFEEMVFGDQGWKDRFQGFMFIPNIRISNIYYGNVNECTGQ